MQLVIQTLTCSLPQLLRLLNWEIGTCYVRKPCCHWKKLKWRAVFSFKRSRSYYRTFWLAPLFWRWKLGTRFPAWRHSRVSRRGLRVSRVSPLCGSRAITSFVREDKCFLYFVTGLTEMMPLKTNTDEPWNFETYVMRCKVYWKM